MKNLLASLLLAASTFGASAPSHAAEGLVCTSVVRYEIATSYPPTLTNGTRFNCGPNLVNVTIPEISAAGWIIILVTSSAFPTNPVQGATQIIIQK